MEEALSNSKIESYYNSLQDYLLFRLHHKLSEFHYDYQFNGAVVKLFDIHRQWPLSVRKQLHKIAKDICQKYFLRRNPAHNIICVCVCVAKYYVLR